MNKKKKFQMKSKHLLVLMTFLCISAILLTFTQVVSVSPLREAASRVIVPFQNGINQVGTWMSGKLEGFQDVEELAAQNKELEQRVAELTEERTPPGAEPGGTGPSSGTVSAGSVLFRVRQSRGAGDLQGSGKLVRYLCDQQGFRRRN